MITLENTKTIYDLVKSARKEYGGKVFVRWEKDDIIWEKSYETFGQDCDAIAAWTEENSRKNGRKIHAALIGKAGYEYLTALVGVMTGGAVSIPLDVQLSKEGFIDHINRSDADVVFYDWEFSSQIEEIKKACIQVKHYICLQNRKNVESITSIHKEYREKEFVSDSKPEDLAVLIFTSGTTGKSKGVMLSQANLIDNVFCGIEADTRGAIALNLLPINHIFCLNGNVLGMMRFGNTLCLCNDLSKMLDYLQLFQPTMIRIVPMMAKMLYNRVMITKKQNPELSMEQVKAMVWGKRLRKVAVGGAYLAESLAVNLSELGLLVGQGYGMSECSPKISAPEYGRMEKIASVGKIVERCKVRVVDGEIQVKSPSVMMGYYKEPELTKEAITEDGWLCTGDLGYVDEDDFVYLTGRKKNLIILSNGENVSPEQIENVFDEDLLITDILVYGEGETIAAEVYPNYEYAQVHHIENIAEEVQKIITMRNEELPSYAKISQCKIRKIPFEKTSSKKIIRPKYFAGKEEKEEKTKNVRKPETKLQQKIYDVVAEVIGDNSVFGIDDNLYQSGLDSLGSILLIEEFQKQLKQNMTLTELLDCNTILKIEEFFEAAKEKQEIDYSVREVYPLTNMQKYFAYIIKGNTTGNLPFTFELDPKVDLKRLKKAIEAVIDAHPGLKGIIKPGETGYYGLFRDDKRKISIPIVKLTEEEWNERVKTLLVPFSYTAEDNLFHISIFETEKAKYLFFDVAHIMGDGITMNILLEDVNKAYRGEKLEKEKYTFYEYVLEEQGREEAGIRPKNLEYIGALMDGIKLNRSILNKKEITDYGLGKNAVIRKRFERLVRKKILYFCKENGVSENVLFLTAFNYCISLFSDEDDVFLNSIHSGRTDSRWARMAGVLFTTYFCRYTREPHERVVELLKKTGSQIMSTMKCFISTQRQSEMFIQFQGDILNVSEIGEGKAKRIRQQLDSLPFHLQVMSDEEGYYMELRYWENRFDKESVEIFLHCYEYVLMAMLEERSVRRLKKHIPEEYYPKHFEIEAQQLNQETAYIGFDLLEGLAPEEKVKVYVLDERYNKKPVGAWGELYIMNHEPEILSEPIDSPYSPGTLYATGITARILPDGTVDCLENGGRTVLTEGMTGRKYYDLMQLEDAVIAFEGVQEVEAYLRYNSQTNEMYLVADIVADYEIDTEALKEAVKAACGEGLVPQLVNVTVE